MLATIQGLIQPADLGALAEINDLKVMLSKEIASISISITDYMLKWFCYIGFNEQHHVERIVLNLLYNRQQDSTFLT